MIRIILGGIGLYLGLSLASYVYRDELRARALIYIPPGAVDAENV